MTEESKTRDCPYCKEEIRVDAIKCKHCGSSVAPEKPAHEGTCPYCKEQIHPEAIKCKHCKSDLRSPGNVEGGCGGNSGAYLTPTLVSAAPGIGAGTAEVFDELPAGAVDLSTERVPGMPGSLPGTAFKLAAPGISSGGSYWYWYWYWRWRLKFRRCVEWSVYCPPFGKCGAHCVRWESPPVLLPG